APREPLDIAEPPPRFAPPNAPLPELPRETSRFPTRSPPLLPRFEPKSLAPPACRAFVFAWRAFVFPWRAFAFPCRAFEFACRAFESACRAFAFACLLFIESPRAFPPNRSAVDRSPYGAPPRCWGLCCQLLFRVAFVFRLTLVFRLKLL